MSRLNWRKRGPGPTQPADPPVFDPDELLGIASADPKVPFDPREVLARVVDGSRFDEFKPHYGTSLVTGWASIHGYPIGVLANRRGVLFSEEANKGTQFIQLANQVDVPLVFLQNTTGYMVGKEYAARDHQGRGQDDQRRDQLLGPPPDHQHRGLLWGRQLRDVRPGLVRFLFAWPNARSAVMGPAQLAGVLSIVARQSAEARGLPFDEEADTAIRGTVETQIEAESLPLFLTARLYDDGIIDPRDTRAILGLSLSIIDNGEIKGTTRLRRVPDVVAVSPIASLLVADRGEIARRIFRTARAMGMACVAVYSDADADSPHVAEADLAVRLPGLSPAETYLRADLLLGPRPSSRAPRPSIRATASCPRTPLFRLCRRRRRHHLGGATSNEAIGDTATTSGTRRSRACP